ncbi:transposase domain-containing protein, partial [Pseudoxanthobacter sp. M-2]|uniref:transposase domain-containing protein n=1 Tax=Pseudoxanthobacter sp. M-2 TaxID=3078754 RepID=UPI0038FCF349
TRSRLQSPPDSNKTASGKPGAVQSRLDHRLEPSGPVRRLEGDQRRDGAQASERRRPGSDRGGDAGSWYRRVGGGAAPIASLVETAKLNAVEPQSYLADVIARIVEGHAQSQIDDLLPWAYAPAALKAVA